MEDVSHNNVAMGLIITLYNRVERNSGDRQPDNMQVFDLGAAGGIDHLRRHEARTKDVAIPGQDAEPDLEYEQGQQGRGEDQKAVADHPRAGTG